MNCDMLKGRMREKKVTQEALAEQIGINKNTMYNKLNGNSSFTVEEAKKISEVLRLNQIERVLIFLQ